MLVYLDTAQIAWLQRAQKDERGAFVEMWRECGCELAISLHVLQEAVKLDSIDGIKRRLRLMHHLRPFRSLPAGSAGVTVREITVQVAALLGAPITDPIASVSAEVFPPMADDGPLHVIHESVQDLQRFNSMAEMTAQLETTTKQLPKQVEKWVDLDDGLEDRLRSAATAMAGEAPGLEEHLRTIGESVAEALRGAGGDVWAAKVRLWGVQDLEALPDLKDDEDLSSAAEFAYMARDAAHDIAVELAVDVEKVLALVNRLHVFRAPGTGLGMAVRRARRKHNRAPVASDQTDAEHLAFAPYVDLMFVDKHTRGLVKQEVRRADGRIPKGAADSVTQVRDLSEVAERIRAAASARGRALG